MIFVTPWNDAAKHYKVKIVEGSLYVRKAKLNDEVASAFERTLLTSPAAYPYFETLTTTFSASTGLHSWKQDNFLHHGPSENLSQYKQSFLG